MAEISAHNDNVQEPLPTTPENVLARLEELDIKYGLHEHDPVFTVAESNFLTERIPGLHCRNLFLRDKKKKNYLVVAANETKIDIKKLQKLIGSDRLSFGSAQRLWQYLGVRPGSVCPFAVINDTANEVEIILDKNMMAASLVNYHPMENHLTAGIAPDGLIKFIESCNHTPRIIDMSAAAPDEEK